MKINLNTNLTIETIKSSKALQGIECEKYYKVKNDKEILDIVKYYEVPSGAKNNIGFFYPPHYIGYYPAPTLADVISNAEELLKPTHENFSSVDNILHTIKEIVSMCYFNKPLSEIEAYILKSIK